MQQPQSIYDTAPPRSICLFKISTLCTIIMAINFNMSCVRGPSNHSTLWNGFEGNAASHPSSLPNPKQHFISAGVSYCKCFLSGASSFSLWKSHCSTTRFIFSQQWIQLIITHHCWQSKIRNSLIWHMRSSSSRTWDLSVSGDSHLGYYSNWKGAYTFLNTFGETESRLHPCHSVAVHKTKSLAVKFFF